MKLFLFEFATCGEKVEDSIAVEGLAMFKSLYDGFSRLCDVRAFVRDEFSYLDLPVGRFEEIEAWLEECDAFLIVAPEDDFLLYELTKIGEKYCYNLGSSSKAIRITSDKWRLYKKLKGKVQMPKTSKRAIGETFVVKPRISCGGSGVAIANELPHGFIAQEYIEGLPLSVSVLVGDEIVPVSVNEQLLKNFEYMGAVVPARLSDDVAFEVANEAVKAVECIKGLHGYVGVDVVYADQPYVIEVNARLTTPSVAFKLAYGMSAAEMIWLHEFDKLDFPEKFSRCELKKSKCSGQAYAKVGDYCIELKLTE